MIKIKKLLSYGGACPYQLEAITDDDKWLYIRYMLNWAAMMILNSSVSALSYRGR